MGTIRRIDLTQTRCFHNITQKQNDAFDLHAHDHYELFYFVNGDVRYILEGRVYALEPGSALLIRAKTFHGMKIDSGAIFERYIVQFMPDSLSLRAQETLLSLFDRPPYYLTDNEKGEIREAFKGVMGAGDAPPSLLAMTVQNRVENLLLSICRHKTAATKGAGEGEKKDSQTVQQVLSYLDANLSSPLTVEGVAGTFYMNPSYLNQLFRRVTGTTMGKYVAYKRVIAAREKIRKGQSAYDAAMQSGFRDYSTFFRTYKKFFKNVPSNAGNDKEESDLWDELAGQ